VLASRSNIGVWKDSSGTGASFQRLGKERSIVIVENKAVLLAGGEHSATIHGQVYGGNKKGGL